jgi:mitogen-activated protein kinase 15
MATLQLLDEKIKTLKQKLNQEPETSGEGKSVLRSLRKHIKRLQRRRKVLCALEARTTNQLKKKGENEKTSQVKVETKEDTKEEAKEKIKKETKGETKEETKKEPQEETKEKISGEPQTEPKE